MHATHDRQLVDPKTAIAVPLAGLIFAAGLIMGAAIDFDAPAVEGQTLSTPVGDRSYDAVEETRSDRGLSTPDGDRSYDAVEETRSDRGLD